MKVYRVHFILAGADHAHNTYVHAADEKEAQRKLADRFSGQPRKIHIESIDETHGKFIIGSEECTGYPIAN